MNKTSIHNLYKEYRNIYKKLEDMRELSLSTDYNNTMKKVLILSCASFFEVQMCEMLERYVSFVSNKNENLISFVKKQALKRKFHTLFDWNQGNANHFLGLFGQSFKEKVQKKFNEDRQGRTEKYMKNFVELVKNRNTMTHEDFADYKYNTKTPYEIFKEYTYARKFIPFIEDILKENVNSPEN